MFAMAALMFQQVFLVALLNDNTRVTGAEANKGNSEALIVFDTKKKSS